MRAVGQAKSASPMTAPNTGPPSVRCTGYSQEVSGRFCPWCIADGSEAERFVGGFTGSHGLDGVSEEILHEVTRRTPGFHAWQEPRWLVHCDDAAAFIGGVGYSQLAAHPEALDD